MQPALNQALDHGWELAHTSPNACVGPQDLEAARLSWHAARVPGTAAAALHADLEAALAAPLDYDAHDWWYRRGFDVLAGAPQPARWRLRFEGLATLAEVWLNGEKILASRNMFREQRVDVTTLLRPRNTLVIVFRSLSMALAEKRKRPRWKTALVSEQNLRWFRTTLLGRIPSWSPPVAPVGPWRPITLEAATGPELKIRDIQSRADQGAGLVTLRANAVGIHGGAIKIAAARLRLGESAYPLDVASPAEGRIDCTLRIPDVPLWWPHTHGRPSLMPAMLEVKVGGEWLRRDCGKLGFKQIEWREEADATRVLINGEPLFCRGACWMPIDPLGLSADPTQLRTALEIARASGVNMLRVGGTTVYESDEFYRLCDEFGILVWQDLMFANMDYPVADEAFRAECEAELAGQLDRLQRH
ncbi:MAG TPA: glycoside hydrolase family 2 protein, partial [Burkholderiales bacterium]|nr:glycoside hydrolase family 2 protein [Burkholderiales bacterium]